MSAPVSLPRSTSRGQAVAEPRSHDAERGHEEPWCFVVWDPGEGGLHFFEPLSLLADIAAGAAFVVIRSLACALSRAGSLATVRRKLGKVLRRSGGRRADYPAQ